MERERNEARDRGYWGKKVGQRASSPPPSILPGISWEASLEVIGSITRYRPSRREREREASYEAASLEPTTYDFFCCFVLDRCDARRRQQCFGVCDARNAAWKNTQTREFCLDRGVPVLGGFLDVIGIEPRHG